MKNVIFATILLVTLSANADEKIGIMAVPFYITEAASAFKLSPALLMAICTQESRCRARAYNKFDSIEDENGIRHKNPSYGLFQIKKETAKALGFEGTNNELFNPEINSFLAAKLLRKNLDRYHDTAKAISAHNAGRAIKSNKDYVNNVFRNYVKFHLDQGVE